MAEKARLHALLPLTFSGISRFSNAASGRVWFCAFIFAAICSIVVTWFVARNITPQVTQAIAKLPRGGRIENRSLVWPGKQAVRLAEGAFLSISVEPRGTQPLASTGDFDLIIASDELRLRSLFGYSAVPYPAGWIWFLDSAELGPKWAAWEFTFLTLLALGTTCALVATWFLLGLLFCLPARLLAFYADRDIRLKETPKLCTMAMVPPGLFMSAAIVFYGTMSLSLPGLLLAGAFHFFLQPVFVAGAVLALPKIADALPPNPFSTAEESAEETPSAGDPKRNPFIQIKAH